MKRIVNYIIKKLKHATVNRMIRLKVRRKQRAIERLSERESTVARIVKAALSDRRNILMIAPLSGTRYIKMPDEGMFIIIGGNNVIISNHKFYYDIDASLTLSDYLIERFNRVLDHQRTSMEKEMLSNVQSGLVDIADHIDKKVKYNESTIREQLRKKSA